MRVENMREVWSMTQWQPLYLWRHSDLRGALIAAESILDGARNQGTADFLPLSCNGEVSAKLMKAKPYLAACEELPSFMYFQNLYTFRGRRKIARVTD